MARVEQVLAEQAMTARPLGGRPRLRARFPHMHLPRMRSMAAALAAGLAAGAFAGFAAAASEPAAPSHNPANLVGHGGPVKSVAVADGGGHALTGSFDYSMMHWELRAERPKQLARFAEHDAAVNAVRFVPDGRRALSAGDDGAVRVWDLESGALVHRFEGHTARAVDLAVSTDGRLAASAGWDRTVRIWNLETLEAGPVLDEHAGPVAAVVFAATDEDVPLLYSAGADGTVRLWEADSGALRRAVYRHGWGINALAVLPDPDQLLFGGLNGTAAVLDLESGAVVRELTEHEGPVLALAVSSSHGLAATGGADGSIRVWRIDSWQAGEEYENPYGPVWSLAFSADGTALYHAGLDDFVAFWRIRPREPFEAAEGTFPRRFQVSDDLSLGERQFARKCSVCHTLQPDDGNRAGPTLYGVFGRRAGTLPGYSYSDALIHSDIVWNEETIDDLFRLGPEHVTPGTKMPLQRMTGGEERDAMIAFLKSATKPNPEGERDSPPREQ